VEGLNHYIDESAKNDLPGKLALAAVVLVILYYIYSKIRDRRRAKAVLAA
jgi:hypothetical protein